MNNLPAIVIWGASGHAAVVADILRLAGQFRIHGFLEDGGSGRRGQPVYGGAPLLGGREELPRLREDGVRHAIVAFGDNHGRLAAGALLEQQGFELVTAIHPSSAVAADAVIGPGSVLAAGSVVNPRARLGAQVIVNTRASVDHDCVLEDGVHVSPAACLAGRVTIGRATWIGAGTTVIDGITVGAGTIVGAGACVVRDLPSGVVAYGVPARARRAFES